MWDPCPGACISASWSNRSVPVVRQGLRASHDHEDWGPGWRKPALFLLTRFPHSFFIIPLPPIGSQI